MVRPSPPLQRLLLRLRLRAKTRRVISALLRPVIPAQLAAIHELSALRRDSRVGANSVLPLPDSPHALDCLTSALRERWRYPHPLAALLPQEPDAPPVSICLAPSTTEPPRPPPRLQATHMLARFSPVAHDATLNSADRTPQALDEQSRERRHAARRRAPKVSASMQQ